LKIWNGSDLKKMNHHPWNISSKKLNRAEIFGEEIVSNGCGKKHS
jgi:hypothetical protein